MSVLTQVTTTTNDLINLSQEISSLSHLSEFELTELKKVSVQLENTLKEYKPIERASIVRFRLLQHQVSSQIQIVQYERVLDVMWLLEHDEVLNGFRIIGPSFSQYPSSALIQDIVKNYTKKNE